MSHAQPFRITLWDMTGSGRGRGSVKAVISHAKYIGVSSYLNEGGEMFFTLPYNHPQISECLPLERHYRVERWDEDDEIYRTVGTGILQDYQATDNEVVFYGIDYMLALNQTLTDVSGIISNPSSTVTYAGATASAIWQAELSAAKNETNSRLGFINIESTINAAATTYDIFTAGEQRGEFLFNIAAIAQEGTTTKVVFGNRIENNTYSYNSFFLDMNYLSAVNNKVRLVYGANVKRFSYSPNFRSLRTRAVLIATSIFGSSASKIWSNYATSSLASTYGLIDRVDVQEDLISVNSVSARAAYNLNESSPDKIKVISLSITDGSIVPYKDYYLGDDVRVIINRGPVSINSTFTIRGQQWIGREDGSEELAFDFYNRTLKQFELSPYQDGSPVSTIPTETSVFLPTTETGPDHLSAPPLGMQDLDEISQPADGDMEEQDPFEPTPAPEQAASSAKKTKKKKEETVKKKKEEKKAETKAEKKADKKKKKRGK